MNSTNFPSELKKKVRTELVQIKNDIDKSFMDHQRIVYNYMNQDHIRGLLIYWSVGTGKCHKKDTPILMFNGSIKQVQHIKPGELLMGDDSTSRQVMSLATGIDEMYTITPNKKGWDSFTVNQEHILCLKSQTTNEIIEISVKKYINLKKNNNFKLYKTFVSFPSNAVPIDPYMLGIWLFDSSNQSGILDTYHHDIMNYFTYNLCKYGLKLIYVQTGYSTLKAFKSVSNINTFENALKLFKLCHNKYIPNVYKCNSVYNRMRLLAGIIDGKGKLDTFEHSFTVSYMSDKLITDVIYLCQSLGFGCYKLVENNLHVLKIIGDIHTIPCLVMKNIVDANKIHKNVLLSGFTIKHVGSDKYYGFTLNGNSRYLMGDFTVTHNTLEASSIAEHFRTKGRDIVFLSVKSLQENFINGIRQYYKYSKGQPISEDKLQTLLKQKYNFVTMNASNMISQLSTSEYLDKQLESINEINLENKLIIVDEAHILFNSIANGSKNANLFYELVMKSKRLKIIFLTGTPIVNEPFELGICFNMCRGPIRNKLMKDKQLTLFPEHYDAFNQYFIESTSNTMRNADKFQNRIFGLVSYYGELYYNKVDKIHDEIKKNVKKDNFPDRKPIEIIKVEMTIPQTVFYLSQREKEKQENTPSGDSIYKEKSGGSIYKEKNLSTSTSYRIKSRQAGNIYVKDNNHFDSPKLEKIYNIINKSHQNQLGVIYSTFLQAGLSPMVTILERHGYHDYTSNKDGPKYAMFTGKIPIDERNHILRLYNSKDNSTGDKISLLLISSTGEKGINLKRVRHLHIIEPTWSYSTTEQIIGRAVRYNSHSDLPKEDQNVQIYQYIADYNSDFVKFENEKDKKLELTSDLTLLLRSIKKKELNDIFLNTVASTSIECEYFNKDINFECFDCIKNDKILYYDDVDTDITELKNNCKRPIKITVEEIIVDNITYYYDIITKDIYTKNENDSYTIVNKIISEKIKKLLK